MTSVQELLKNTVVLALTVRSWGNRSKADVDKIDTGDTDKNRLNVTKRLIDSDEYKALRRQGSTVKDWARLRSVPSFFRDGLWLVKTDAVNAVDAKLREGVDERKRLTEALLTVYPEQKEKAKTALGKMFRESDYPTASELRNAFGIDWNWISLGVAETLPSDVRRQENAKLERMWKSAIGEITVGLRTGFKELIDHMVSRLTVTPGEKPRVFRDTLVQNFTEFVETFSARNVVNDNELAALVEKARKLVSGVSPDDLRDDAKLRDYTAGKFRELQKAVDTAVVTASRKFDFSE